MSQDDTGQSNRYPLRPNGWYRAARFVVRLVLWIVVHPRIVGREYIPEQGPFLLVTNHLHWLDTPLLAVTIPYRIYVFAAEKWGKHWFLGPFFRSLNAIFVRRGEVDRQALRQALDVLNGGGILGVAPEGTRSKTGALQQGRSGAAYMALRTGVKILPVVVTGQEKVFPSLRRVRRARVRVLFGQPFTPPSIEGKASPAEVDAFTTEIMYRLAAMLPPEYRGVYADVEDKRPDLVAQLQTESISMES